MAPERSRRRCLQADIPNFGDRWILAAPSPQKTVIPAARSEATGEPGPSKLDVEAAGFFAALRVRMLGPGSPLLTPLRPG